MVGRRFKKERVFLLPLRVGRLRRLVPVFSSLDATFVPELHVEAEIEKEKLLILLIKKEKLSTVFIEFNESVLFFFISC